MGRPVAVLLILASTILAQRETPEELRVDFEKRSVRLIEAELLDRLRLARWARLRGMEEEGQKQIDLILKLRPEHPGALKERAREARAGRKPARSDPKTYAKRVASLAKNRLRRHHQLAEWCERKGLESERKRLFERILAFDTDDAKARAALGFVEFEGRWCRPGERRLLEQGLVRFEKTLWVSRELREALETGKFAYNGALRTEPEMDRIRSEWGRHWELGTANLRIHSNLELRKVIAIAHRLEFAWRAVPELFDLHPTPSETRYVANFFRTRKELQRMHPDYDLSVSTNLYLPDSMSTMQLPTIDIVRHAASNLFEAVVDQGRGTVNVYGAQDRSQWIFLGTSDLMSFLDERDGDYVLNKAALISRMGGALPLTKERLLRITGPGRTLETGEEFNRNAVLGLFLCAYLFDAEGGKHRPGYLSFVNAVCSKGKKLEAHPAFKPTELAKHLDAFNRWVKAK